MMVHTTLRGWFCPSFFMNEASINKYLLDNPQKDPRVVWQRHQYMKQEDANISKTATANNHDQVVVTLQGFPYLTRDGLKQKLDIVTPYLVTLLKDNLNIDCALEWMHTNQTLT